MKKQKSTNFKGITLIALVVTIVVLLILAGISINALSGENGIIGQAKGGKDSAEISEEKEILNISVVQAIDEDIYGNIKTEIFRNKLNNNAGEGKTEIIDSEESIIARFIEKNRYYEIDKDGNVDGPKDLIDDQNAGDISKDGKLNGSEEKPFEINCIEDLVTFSIMVNEGNSFSGKNVILMRTLDFKSIFSYNDYTTKEFGDLNSDGVIEDIRTELTKTDEGCIGFTPIGDEGKGQAFEGTFDGKNNKICNLYENTGDNNAGLFGYLVTGKIKNLGMKNLTLTSNNTIGGIVALQEGESIISSCYIEGNLQFSNSEKVGCIIGYADNFSIAIIENCYSTGKLELQEVQKFGGILGRVNGAPCTIKKCYNIMDIYNTREEGMKAGGILAEGWGYHIEECYHIGNIENPVDKGTSCGIAADGSNVKDVEIKNCYSIGNMVGNIAGGITKQETDIFNCYSIGKIIRTYEGGTINGMNYGGHIVHCFSRRGDFHILPEGDLSEEQIISELSEYNTKDNYGHGDKAVIGYKCNVLYENEMKTQEFVDELNNLITAGTSGENEGVITEESQSVWKMDSNNINNGYPILQWQE